MDDGKDRESEKEEIFSYKTLEKMMAEVVEVLGYPQLERIGPSVERYLKSYIRRIFSKEKEGGLAKIVKKITLGKVKLREWDYEKIKEKIKIEIRFKGKTKEVYVSPKIGETLEGLVVKMDDKEYTIGWDEEKAEVAYILAFGDLVKDILRKEGIPVSRFKVWVYGFESGIVFETDDGVKLVGMFGYPSPEIQAVYGGIKVVLKPTEDGKIAGDIYIERVPMEKRRELIKILQEGILEGKIKDAYRIMKSIYGEIMKMKDKDPGFVYKIWYRVSGDALLKRYIGVMLEQLLES